MEGRLRDCGFEICAEEREGAGGGDLGCAVMMDRWVTRRHHATKDVAGSLNGATKLRLCIEKIVRSTFLFCSWAPLVKDLL